MKDMKVRLRNLKDELANESHARETVDIQLAEETKVREQLEQMKVICMQIKREKSIGRLGGATR